jgi:hypothetical protein
MGIPEEKEMHPKDGGYGLTPKEPFLRTLLIYQLVRLRLQDLHGI